MTELRSATQSIHEKIHKLPYFKAIQNDSLLHAQYANHLHALAIIWCSLERQMAAENGKIASLAECMVSKWPALEHDLKNLGEQPIAGTVVARALDIVSDMLLRSTENARAIVGYAYVMQGSMNGAHALRQHIVAALGNDRCVNYLDAGGGDFRHQWAVFGRLVDELKLSANDRQAILAAAQAIFSELHDLFSEIGDLTSDTGAKKYITSVNPEAGNHAMPENPAIIAAALRAGMKAWADYPYLKLRYGERGKRFAKSDSCWLATLANLPQSDADQQISWLARLLAARGLPSIILVRHLDYLAQALAAAPPAGDATPAVLSRAAEKLYSHAAAGMQSSAFQQTAADLQKRLSAIAAFPENTGEVLLSAEMDSKVGLSANGESAPLWYERSFCHDNHLRTEFLRILESI